MSPLEGGARRKPVGRRAGAWRSAGWVALLLFWSAPVAAQDLRTVITLSGGVSLGVYEGGKSWVLAESLRRQAIAGRADLVAVTGASAGSINSLLTALHYCAGDGNQSRVDDNEFRRAWIDVDLDQLIPADGAQYDRLPGLRDGLLSRTPMGDTLDLLREAMDAEGYREGCRVRLGLVVTRNRAAVGQVESIEVRTQRFLVPLEARVEQGRLVFRNFHALPDPDGIAHILLPAAADGRVASADVIRASLASSAFPLAFGRVRLEHCARRPAAPASTRCRVGYAPDSATFIDGGIFDNLPLGAAMVLAEAHQPASESLAYRYLYIDPGRRRALGLGEEIRPQRLPGPALPETDYYGLLDQIGFVLDALLVAHRRELAATLRHNQWGERRQILLTTRYMPLTADYLLHFGAFLDRDFRRFDYYAGVYDGVIYLARMGCREVAAGTERADCVAAAARREFQALGLSADVSASTLFAHLGRYEFCPGLACGDTRWSWLVPNLRTSADDSLVAIFDALTAPDLAGLNRFAEGTEILVGPPFTEFLQLLGLSHQGHSASLRRMIEHPDAWHHPYLRRAAARLRQLELEKQAALPETERPDNLPFVVFAGLLNYSAHTYTGAEAGVALPISTAPPGYAWYVPDEIAIDGSQTGTVFTWRGVLAPLGESTYLEWEVAPLHWTRSTDERENFAHAGLNLRWRTGGFGLSSFGVGVGAYADWEDQPDSDRTGFLVGASAGLLADKLRVGLGFLRGETRRDGNGFLFTIGLTDLKGLAYWL